VVGEGAGPSRHADLAFTGVYRTPLHGWYPPFGRVVFIGSNFMPAGHLERRFFAILNF
jgi:hypothetical protein